MIIKNGTIHNAVVEEAFVSDIKIENGKIAAIAQSIEAKEDEEVIDASGKEIYPGFVEAHCHVGLARRAGQGRGNADHNESNDVVTPHLRAIDGIDPMDENFAKARLAGITTVCTGPGSLNAIGGTFVAMKTYGICVDKMIIKNDVAMKCAFGENIKFGHGSKSTATRMTIAAVMRDILSKAKRYMEKIDAANGDKSKYPPYDIKLESLLPVMRRQIPLKAHAHQANDIFTAIRIAKEFDLKLTLEHVTDGHLIVDELAQTGLYMAVGPTLTNAEKIELRNKSWQTPGALSNAGCHVSIITDSPVISLDNLPICAAYAIKAGMKPFDALQAITINAAEHAGVADRVGSIEVGKDADIIITDGNPFEVFTNVETVIIDGNIITE
ncbi:MAG: amidohydrolase [Ruminococcaceae bacterium]|nr:amidohydrolase [Oscillospiraceae bacterium]